MEFNEKIKSFAQRAKKLKNNILTEEATKTSLIMPFFQILGYDVFNPNEFVPEFTADVGIKKGEKVDYAILSKDENPSILIEAKSINEELTKHDSQLFRYFGTSTAKFAILTNGLIYKFFTDLEETNKMDTKPFLEIDILNLKDLQITELTKFHKENFDIDNIMDTASELKYMGLIKQVLRDNFTNPTDDFVKFILNSGVYEGIKTQNIIEKYSPIVKKCITIYINDLVNDKIKNALTKEEENKTDTFNSETTENETIDQIITTEEEIESYYIIKSILGNVVDVKRISYKDTLNYFSVLLDNKVTKWICRIYLKEKIKYVIIPNEQKENIKYTISDINDLYNLHKELETRINQLNN